MSSWEDGGDLSKSLLLGEGDHELVVSESVLFSSLELSSDVLDSIWKFGSEGVLGCCDDPPSCLT